jgi:peroxiredoxin
MTKEIRNPKSKFRNPEDDSITAVDREFEEVRSSRSRRLLLMLPVSAAVIAALVAFKLTRRYEPAVEESPGVVRPAPLFQLYDQHSQIVRLARDVGRHKLLIVFYDGSRGPDGSVLLGQLRDRFPDLHSTGASVLAISASRPSENRYGVNLEHRPTVATPTAAGERHYPFPLLSDILDFEVHRQYGAFDFDAQKPREAVFVVDQSGLIQFAHFGLKGLGQIDDWIRELNAVR